MIIVIFVVLFLFTYSSAAIRSPPVSHQPNAHSSGTDSRISQSQSQSQSQFASSKSSFLGGKQKNTAGEQAKMSMMGMVLVFMLGGVTVGRPWIQVILSAETVLTLKGMVAGYFFDGRDVCCCNCARSWFCWKRWRCRLIGDAQSRMRMLDEGL